jgi:hypothetical protein
MPAISTNQLILNFETLFNALLASFADLEIDKCAQHAARCDRRLGAIKADLEFLIERTERFRREQALRPLYVMVGSAGIVIA